MCQSKLLDIVLAQWFHHSSSFSVIRICMTSLEMSKMSSGAPAIHKRTWFICIILQNIYIYIVCVLFFSLQISYLLGILNFCVHAGWSRVCACACVCLFACPSKFACLHACLPMCLCLAFLPARKPVSESSRALVATSWARPLRALSV